MRALKWTGGILLALVVALALFIAFGLSTLKGPITRAVTDASGRELRIDGAFKPVFIGRVILPEVRLQRPIIDLEIDEEGRKNWLLERDQQKEGGSRISIL